MSSLGVGAVVEMSVCDIRIPPIVVAVAQPVCTFHSDETGRTTSRYVPDIIAVRMGNTERTRAVIPLRCRQRSSLRPYTSIGPVIVSRPKGVNPHHDVPQRDSWYAIQSVGSVYFLNRRNITVVGSRGGASKCQLDKKSPGVQNAKMEEI